MSKLIYITVLGTFIGFLASCEKTETVEATETTDAAATSTTDAAPAKTGGK